MMKNLLKNSWILALMIVIISTSISFLASLFVDMGSVIAVIVTIFTAMSAGQIYFISFKKLMPKMLRLKTAFNYLAIQVVFGMLAIFVFEIVELWILIVFVILGFVAAAIVYWAIGFGGKMQLNLMEKKKNQ